MGDIGTERREIEFEPLDPPATTPERQPAAPAPAVPAPTPA